ncbi:zinc ribbon domain-containing protein [Lachnospiraceae bacterium 62-35]
MKCSFCGTEIQEQATVCPACGRRTGPATESTPPSGEPVEGNAPYMQAGDRGAYSTGNEYFQGGSGYSQGSYGMNEAPAPKKKAGKIIAAGAVIAALAAVGVFAGIKMMEKDPKEVVIDAFKSVYAPDNPYPSEELFGWEALAKSSRTKNMEGGFSLVLNETSNPMFNFLAGTGVDSVSRVNIGDKKINGDMSAKVANMDLCSLKIYMDEKSLAVSVPELSKKVFLLNYGDDLEKQVEDNMIIRSALSQAGIEASAVESYFTYLWSFYDEADRPFDLPALWERYKTGSAAMEEFKEAMTVEKAEPAVFTVNGKEVKCKGYDVVISQEAVIDFIETTSEFFMEDDDLKGDVREFLSQVLALGGREMVGMSPEELQIKAWKSMEEYADQAIAAMEESVEDIEITVYVDKKGRMAGLNGVTSLSLEDGVYDFELEAQFKGGSYVTQNMESQLSISHGGDTVTFVLEREGVYDKDKLNQNQYLRIKGVGDRKIKFSCESEYDIGSGDYHLRLVGGVGSEEGGLSIDGAVSDLKAGESVNISMDKIAFTWNGSRMAVLSGDYYLKPLEGEIDMPDGEVMDIMSASITDWVEVSREVENNMDDLTAMLESLAPSIGW